MIRCVLLLMLLGGWWCSILAAEDPLIGTWRSASGDFFQFRPDGTAIVKGALVRWRVMNGQLVLSSSDGQVNLPYTLSGNQIVVQSEEGIGAYSRYENAAPVALAFDSATAPVGTIPRAETLSVEVITGVWLGPEGTSVLRPGGVGKAQGITFTWSIEGQSLLLRHADKQAQMPARLEGGKLILGTGPEIAYTRAIGAAGWWCAWDGPVDSRQSKGEFHHFALLPNGTASFAKGDLGAMRTGGWFSTSHDATTIQVIDHWEQRGEDVQISLGITRYQAYYDETRQVLVVRGMGQINQGADLTFARE